MNWDDIRVFLSVARAQNLARGARDAGLDRSTASRRIAALETSLGARLFLRTREGLRTSVTGQQLLEHAERMQLEARALTQRASIAGGEITGTVRLATTDAMSVLLIEEGLLALRERHPGVVIELLSGNRPLDLTRGEADLAVRISAVRGANVKIRRLARQQVALFASTRYTLDRGAPTQPKALRGHDVLLPSGDLVALPEAKWLGSQPGVRVVFRTNSMPSLYAAAVAGAGIAPLTESWGAREPTLRKLFVLEHIAPRPLWLAIGADAAARPEVRYVAQSIVEGFARFESRASSRVAATTA